MKAFQEVRLDTEPLPPPEYPGSTFEVLTNVGGTVIRMRRTPQRLYLDSKRAKLVEVSTLGRGAEKPKTARGVRTILLDRNGFLLHPNALDIFLDPKTTVVPPPEWQNKSLCIAAFGVTYKSPKGDEFVRMIYWRPAGFYNGVGIADSMSPAGFQPGVIPLDTKLQEGVSTVVI